MKFKKSGVGQRSGVMQRLGSRSGGQESGFTLIELLVVIVILGILAAVVVFAVRGLNDRGEASAQEMDARALHTAQEAHYAQHGRYATEDELVELGFLRRPSGLHDVAVDEPDRQTYEVLPAGVVRGGSMAVAGGDTSGVLNPAVTTAGNVHQNAEVMYNGLLGWSKQDTAVPDLAQSYAISADGRTATFTLRPGLKFHNGSALTAKDVKFTFDEALLRWHSRTQASMGPALGVTGSGNAATVPAGAITMPGGPEGLTVQFNFLYGYSPLLRQMNVTEAPIISQQLYQACAGVNINTTACAPNSNPVGTGPFKFASRDATNITYTKNAEYHRPGLPYLDQVVRVAGANFAGLQTDAIQYLGSIPVTNQAAALGDPNITTVAAPNRGPGGGHCISTMAFNLTAKGDTAGHNQPVGVNGAAHPVLGDVRVRRAITHAIDRNAFVANALSGQGIPAPAPIHSALTDAHSPGGYGMLGFNRATAESLLDQAGFPRAGGTGMRPINLELVGFASQTGPWGAVVQDHLQQVGISVTLTAYADMAVPFGNRSYDMLFASYCNGDEPQIGVRRQLHSNQVGPAAFTNASGYKSQTMDDAWHAAAQAPLGSPEYKAAYRTVMTEAVDRAVHVWLSEGTGIHGHRARCQGFNHQNTGLVHETAWCAAP